MRGPAAEEDRRLPDPRPNHLTWRLFVLAGLVGVAMVVLIGRLAVIQILDHERYAEEAAATHAGIVELPAPRGNILDATGFPLATSADTWDVYIDRWLGLHTEVAIERSTGAIKAVLVEIDRARGGRGGANRQDDGDRRARLHAELEQTPSKCDRTIAKSA